MLRVPWPRQSLAAASTQDSQDVEMKDAQNTTALVPVDDKKLTPQERALEHALKMAAMTPEEVQDLVFMGFSIYIIYITRNNTSDLEALKPKYALIHRATLTRKKPLDRNPVAESSTCGTCEASKANPELLEL